MSYSEMVRILLSREWGESAWTDPIGFNVAVADELRALARDPMGMFVPVLGLELVRKG